MIKLELIDKDEQRQIAKRFLPLIEKFYENPKNQKAFEAWKEKRSNILIRK